MKTLILIFSFLIISLDLISSEINIKSEEVNSASYLGLLTYHNKLLVTGFNNTISGNERWFFVELFDGYNWETINLEYEGDTLLATAISFDSEGNIWIAFSNEIYMWDGNKLINRIKVNFDGLYEKRTINKMMFDSTGNLWIINTITHKIENNVFDGFSQLIRYDFDEFKLIDSLPNWSYSVESGLYTKKNGDVIVTLSTTNKDNLFVYKPNLDYDVFTIPSPYKLIKPSIENRRTNIKQIFEDSNENLWFSIKKSEPFNSGLLLWEKNRNWETFSTENGYLMIRDQFKASGFDSIFAECNGVTQDSEGKIWICGTGGFLNTVNEDFEVEFPDTTVFFNNLTFYGTKIIADTSKINYPHKRYAFMRNIDSLHQLIIKYMNQSYHTIQNGYSPYGWVSGIAHTNDGSLWIAINHLGILRFQNPNITDVETDDATNGAKLFPNPVPLSNPNIKLQLEKPENISSIRIFDLEGNTLLNKNINRMTTRLDIDLNREDFSTGTYFTAIYIDNKIIFRKFVIN